ncbi:hypothetical protein HZB01_04680 [Candidatus Woesearchaeota archaeon]|nr:hypothetical protein [Candidatus Woesearchaeota archaeon]
METKKKEKVAGIAGSISGAASILGSWQVCHSVCLGLIALLGLIGITVTGMPLFFLTKIALPLWIIAVVLLMGLVIVSHWKQCISKNLLLFNSGLIIAGTPFAAVQKYAIVLWTVGGALALVGIILFIAERRKTKKGGKTHGT